MVKKSGVGNVQVRQLWAGFRTLTKSWKPNLWTALHNPTKGPYPPHCAPLLPAGKEHFTAIPAPGSGVKEHYSQTHESPECHGPVWHLPSLWGNSTSLLCFWQSKRVLQSLDKNQSMYRDGLALPVQPFRDAFLSHMERPALSGH